MFYTNMLKLLFRHTFGSFSGTFTFLLHNRPSISWWPRCTRGSERQYPYRHIHRDSLRHRVL